MCQSTPGLKTPQKAQKQAALNPKPLNPKLKKKSRLVDVHDPQAALELRVAPCPGHELLDSEAPEESEFQERKTMGP